MFAEQLNLRCDDNKKISVHTPTQPGKHLSGVHTKYKKKIEEISSYKYFV